MKKLFLFAFALVLTTAVSAQFKVGGGLTIGSQAAADESGEKVGLGLTLKGDYAFNDQWTISPDFTFFLPSGGDYGDFTLWQLNANAHYYFSSNEQFLFYGLAGLNYSHWKWDYESDYGGVAAEWDDSEIGLNLGVGANMQQFFGEIKYDTAFEQIALSVGILF